MARNRILDAVAMIHSGDRSAALRELTGIWAELTPSGNPYDRCVVAHYLADLQEDVNQELQWDLRALAAAHLMPDKEARRSFLPSLHLNLASCYERLGDLPCAREHVRLATQFEPEEHIAAALERISNRVAETLGDQR